MAADNHAGRSARTRKRVVLPVVLIVLAGLAAPIVSREVWLLREQSNIHHLHEEARRLGGDAEIPEGGIDYWGWRIQLIVDLSNSKVGDEELARLQRMPGFQHLSMLSLAGSRITDKSLKLLESYPGLISVNLSHTGVTDKGLESLAKLPSLSNINLSGTNVTDAGLDALIRSRRYLVGVDLTKTKVTAEGLRRFSEAFPQVYITPDRR
ncbi:MAG: hypothetical protein ACHRXM_09315 [Isosphaerales bacterium]